MKDQLPVPLSNFQTLNLLDELHLRHLCEQISSSIGCKVPQSDFKAFVDKYHKITEVHRRGRALRDWYARLLSWNPELSRLQNEEELEILISAEADLAFRQVQELFTSERFLEFQSRGFAMGTQVGIHETKWNVRKGVEYIRVLESLATPI